MITGSNLLVTATVLSDHRFATVGSVGIEKQFLVSAGSVRADEFILTLSDSIKQAIVSSGAKVRTGGESITSDQIRSLWYRYGDSANEGIVRIYVISFSKDQHRIVLDALEYLGIPCEDDLQKKLQP